MLCLKCCHFLRQQLILERGIVDLSEEEIAVRILVFACGGVKPVQVQEISGLFVFPGGLSFLHFWLGVGKLAKLGGHLVTFSS